MEDPWVGIEAQFPINTSVMAKVTNLTDYGFAEIEEGVEGLVHVSEIDWTNKNIHPSKVVQLGDSLEVMILEVDEEKRRISLGLKQLSENPWQVFEHKHNEGEKITGVIKSITDFGVFIELEGGIDGLVHLSDISWDEDEEAVRALEKGQDVEAVILAIDSERERISLGIKQLQSDAFSDFCNQNKRGSRISAKVTRFDDDKIYMSLAEGVEGYLPQKDFQNSNSDSTLEEGLEMEVVIANLGKKTESYFIFKSPRESRRKRSLTRTRQNKQRNRGFIKV